MPLVLFPPHGEYRTAEAATASIIGKFVAAEYKQLYGVETEFRVRKDLLKSLYTTLPARRTPGIEFMIVEKDEFSSSSIHEAENTLADSPSNLIGIEGLMLLAYAPIVDARYVLGGLRVGRFQTSTVEVWVKQTKNGRITITLGTSNYPDAEIEHGTKLPFVTPVYY
jgi:hypothetical protein